MDESYTLFIAKTGEKSITWEAIIEVKFGALCFLVLGFDFHGYCKSYYAANLQFWFRVSVSVSILDVYWLMVSFMVMFSGISSLEFLGVEYVMVHWLIDRHRWAAGIMLYVYAQFFIFPIFGCEIHPLLS